MVRAPKSKEGYAAIGGGSPLRKITDDQVDFNSLLCLSSSGFFLCMPCGVFYSFAREIPLWPFPVIFNKNSAYFWFKFRLELTKLLWFVVLVQAFALKMALEEKGLSSNVYIGMRYWYPFTEEAVHQVNPCTFWSTVTIVHCPCYSHHTFMFFHN